MREVPVMQAASPRQIPDPSDRAQLWAVGGKIVEREPFGMLFPPGAVRSSMVVLRFVVTLEFVGFHFSFREKLRHFGEGREGPSLGGRQRLCSGQHLQKATKVGPELVQNPADSERHDLLKTRSCWLFRSTTNEFPNPSHAFNWICSIYHGATRSYPPESFRRLGSNSNLGVLQNKSSSSNFSAAMLVTREQPGPSCSAATRP